VGKIILSCSGLLPFLGTGQEEGEKGEGGKGKGIKKLSFLPFNLFPFPFLKR